MAISFRAEDIHLMRWHDLLERILALSCLVQTRQRISAGSMALFVLSYQETGLITRQSVNRGVHGVKPWQ